jgi:hypothetical protein
MKKENMENSPLGEISIYLTFKSRKNRRKNSCFILFKQLNLKRFFITLTTGGLQRKMTIQMRRTEVEARDRFEAAEDRTSTRQVHQQIFHP